MQTPTPSGPEGHVALAQATLVVLFLVLLIGGALWILRPFIGPAIWAAMITIASWPAMRRLQARVGGRRWLAATLMSLGLLLLLIVPLLLAIGTIVENAGRIVELGRAAAALRMGEPPALLAAVPLVGGWLADFWRDAASAGLGGLLERLTPYAGRLSGWFVAQVGGVGFVLVQFLLTVALAAVMYQRGEAWAQTVLRVGERLGGERGRHVVELAGSATRGVALGVGVTAIVQSVLGGIALAIAGVPLAGLLTAVMLMLCLAQLGPLLVLLPAAGWLFWQGATGWAVFVLVVSAIVTTLDGVLRPVLIKLGADLPLILIFAGAIGGLLAFGLVGIFVGPVVLAVAWTLLTSWIAAEEPESAPVADLPPGGDAV